MKQLSVLNWIVFAVGASIIGIIFFMFLYGAMPQNLFWLDLIISVVAYALVYLRAVQPMADLDDPAHRQVSFLGLSLVSVSAYAIGAVLAMVVMHFAGAGFKVQLLVQIILAFLLLLSFMVGARMCDKTVEVFNQQQQMLSGLDSLRRAFTRLDRTVAVTAAIPAAVKGHITELKGKVRYITPSNNLEAVDLEREMVGKIGRLESLCADYELNAESIDRALAELDHIMDERKSILITP